MNEQTPKPRRGCFFYGCITSLVLLALMLGALLLGLHYVRKVVNQFTDTQPMKLPSVQMSQPEIENLKQRFETFQAAIRERRPARPLTLTGDEINGLIASGPERQALKDKVYARLEGNQLQSEVSLPLQDLGLSMFKGRYLNGNATFDVALRNGVLFVSAHSIVVKGKPLPEVYMQEIRRQNLAAGVINDPGAVAVLQGLRDIQVKDGTLVLEPKDAQ